MVGIRRHLQASGFFAGGDVSDAALAAFLKIDFGSKFYRQAIAGIVGSLSLFFLLRRR